MNIKLLNYLALFLYNSHQARYRSQEKGVLYRECE
jgi:hypothetical protein